jgi:hypothetical protein
MVCASMDVDIYNVNICGWADNGYMRTSCLPAALHDTMHTQFSLPSHLPDRPQTPEDYVPCLYPREFLALAAPRETNSSIPKHLHRKKKLGMIFLMKEESKGKSKLWTYLLPIAVSLFKVGCRIEG